MGCTMYRVGNRQGAADRAAAVAVYWEGSRADTRKLQQNMAYPMDNTNRRSNIVLWRSSCPRTRFGRLDSSHRVSWDRSGQRNVPRPRNSPHRDATGRECHTLWGNNAQTSNSHGIRSRKHCISHVLPLRQYIPKDKTSPGCYRARQEIQLYCCSYRNLHRTLRCTGNSLIGLPGGGGTKEQPTRLAVNRQASRLIPGNAC